MTLEVGESKTIFRAHGDLLCKKSKFFEACLRNGFSEGIQNKVVLKDDSPKAVAGFMDWLYQVPTVVNIQDIRTSEITALYRFADKVCSEAYHNDLMDAIRKGCQDKNMYPASTIMTLFGGGLMESQMFSFMLDGWAYDMVKNPQFYIDGKLADHTKKWLSHPEITSRLLQSIWKFQNSLPSQVPFALIGCHYHTHANGVKCSGVPDTGMLSKNGRSPQK